MREFSVGSNPTAATLTTVYTVPNGYYGRLVTLIANNQTASNKHVTFDWVDASAGQTYSFIYQYTVTSKQYLAFPNYGYIVFEEGDALKVTTETGSTYAIVATFELEGSVRA